MQAHTEPVGFFIARVKTFPKADIKRILSSFVANIEPLQREIRKEEKELQALNKDEKEQYVRIAERLNKINETLKSYASHPGQRFGDVPLEIDTDKNRLRKEHDQLDKQLKAIKTGKISAKKILELQEKRRALEWYQEAVKRLTPYSLLK